MPQVHRKYLLLIPIHVSLLIISCSLFGQENLALSDSSFYNNKHVRVVFYNTENFFDTYRDSIKNDSDYTPEAARHWNARKYYRKLSNISKVLIAAGEWEAPGIIGLCEVENKLVLRELIHKTPLKKYNYEIIHFDSPDERGLDVALLYRPEIIKPIYSAPIRIHLPSDTTFKTRDILYVKGILLNKDTVHFFVNHWSSRLSGRVKSERRRIFTASILKHKTDSLFARNRNTNILIMGDFNDEPSDSSISHVLNARCGCEMSYPNYGLTDLMCKNKTAGEWTFLYNINSKLFTPQKDILDQFIVSCNLLNSQNRLSVKDDKAYIFKKDWLLKEDGAGNKRPFSTYNGFKYNGGFSDHLPIYIDLIYNNW